MIWWDFFKYFFCNVFYYIKKNANLLISSIRKTQFDQSSPSQPVAKVWGVPWAWRRMEDGWKKSLCLIKDIYTLWSGHGSVLCRPLLLDKKTHQQADGSVNKWSTAPLPEVSVTVFLRPVSLPASGHIFRHGEGAVSRYLPSDLPSRPCPVATSRSLPRSAGLVQFLPLPSDC